MKDDLFNILSAGVFGKMLSGNTFKFAQYNAFCAFLIANRIPFDVTYNPETRRDDTQLSVTVYINPNLTMELSFTDLDISSEGK